MIDNKPFTGTKKEQTLTVGIIKSLPQLKKLTSYGSERPSPIGLISEYIFIEKPKIRTHKMNLRDKKNIAKKVFMMNLDFY